MLEYSHLELSDFENVKHLYTKYLNGGEEIEQWILDGLIDTTCSGVKCMDGDRMVGMISARRGIEFTCGHQELVDLIAERYKDYTIFTGDMLFVHPDYRGMHIAQNLASGMRRNLIAEGCERLVVEGWHRSEEDDVPVEGIRPYLCKSYDLIGLFEDFYKDIKAHGITCPECGSEICYCGAKVMVLDVTE